MGSTLLAMYIHNHQWEVLEGIDVSRRVGWAKYYDEAEAREQTELLNRTLLAVLYDLSDLVLGQKKGSAFAMAHRIRFGRDPEH